MISAPILPLAPTRLSTTNCWPRRWLSFWPSMRASTSAVLAGGKGTMKWTGRAGHGLSAATGWATPASFAAASNNIARTNNIVSTGAERFMARPFRAARVRAGKPVSALAFAGASLSGTCARASRRDDPGEIREQVGNVVEGVEARLRRYVRRQYHVLEVQKLVVAAPGRRVLRIERKAAEVSGPQGLDQCGSVHNFGPRDVDEASARLHLREPAPVDEMAGGWSARQLGYDPIAGRQQLLERNVVDL